MRTSRWTQKQKANFGKNIASIREQMGVSRQDLATALEVSLKTVDRLETGNPGNASVMEDLASMVGISTSDLFKDTPPRIRFRWRVKFKRLGVVPEGLMEDLYQVIDRYNEADAYRSRK